MNIIRGMFGRKKQDDASASKPSSTTKDPATDPNMVRVYDEYGRECYIEKNTWRTNVLPGALNKARDSPDQLANVVTSALEDGFAADALPYAEILNRTDLSPSRGAAILGATYIALNRFDDAQRVLEAYIGQHGEEATIVLNLAKVYSGSGNSARSKELLWRALQLDPNQSNALLWYIAQERERGGDAAGDLATQRVAAIPGSWRARLWLARTALERKDLAGAVSLYEDSLQSAPRPLPSDLLMQMGGDLGNSGHLVEIISLVQPHFDATSHGLLVGNNLIKANIDLGSLDRARRILTELYAQQRADWAKTLAFWETELNKAELAKRATDPAAANALEIITIEGPLWSRDQSPIRMLLPPKDPAAVRIAFFGSTVTGLSATAKQGLQLGDAQGRLSRSIPLLLAEHIQMQTDAVGLALLLTVPNQGFALLGRPYEDGELCELVGRLTPLSGLVCSIVIDITSPSWSIKARLLRQADRHCVSETTLETSVDDSGTAAESVADWITQVLVATEGVHSVRPLGWYERPTKSDATDYLLRLEQQLAVLVEVFYKLGLAGERAIMDGSLQLCLRQPKNVLVRILLAQTMREMKKARPEVVGEFTSKIELLQKKCPLSGPASDLINRMIAEAVG